MSFEPALVAFLAADPELSVLVGDRIEPEPLPDKVRLPAIVYSRVSGVRTVDYEGGGGLVPYRYQFDIWATTRASAQAVAYALRRALLGYRGPMGDYEDVSVTRQETDWSTYDTDVQRHRVVHDYRIWVHDI